MEGLSEEIVPAPRSQWWEESAIKTRGCVFPEKGMAGPERTSFGLRAAERGWYRCRVGRTGREQTQEVGRGQIEGPRGHSQASGFILRERGSHGSKCSHWDSVSP